MQFSRLWVHVDTDTVEDGTDAEVRTFFWQCIIIGIPRYMVKHLYNGDIAGLLLALLPHHQGRADELQQRAVVTFDKIKKVNVPYLMFREAIDARSYWHQLPTFLRKAQVY